ncbi:MAG TPA: TetR-like C-terminal domain-containing protein [Egibacteraceae bacterium]|nr:TetR-like C-terminal domain-containing protein [Egibacteraceae bacterium]
MGAKVGVTLDDVLDAALTIADERGLAAVTLTETASALGIRTPSLYNHVGGLEGLRRQLRLRGAAALAMAFRAVDAGGEPAHVLRALARAYRRFARQRPGLYEAIQPAVAPGEDDQLYAALQEPVLVVVDVLRRVPLADPDLIPAVRAFRAMLHGFADLERRGGFGMPVDIDSSFEMSIDLVIDGLLGHAQPSRT